MPNPDLNPAVDVAIGIIERSTDPGNVRHPVRIALTSMAVKLAGVELPYAGESMAAYKAALIAADIVEARGADPEDFNG